MPTDRTICSPAMLSIFLINVVEIWMPTGPALLPKDIVVDTGGQEKTPAQEKG